MKFVRSFLACATVACLCALLLSCAGVPAPAPSRDELAGRVRELLDRYAANDQEGVLAMMDPSGFVLYGSDLAEVVRSPADLRAMMRDDFRLWGSARFGAPTDLDIRMSAELATATFHAPFTVGANPAVVVRFSTTWQRRPDGWHLVQSANTVPTRGSSVRELLSR